ncbi:MAG: efflux RND transporter periplasmic adaptor subunit [Rhodovarius sp.]|nr:efflux RND transporter periplasmic adaptor subunit [Rhodovarius sp.]
MRRILIALLLLAALGGGLWYWQGLPGLARAEGSGLRLRTAEVDRGPITAVVSATGTVNPVTSVVVGSQLSGQVREIFADYNSRVSAQQPLARLDTQQLEAARAAAEADLRAAEAAVLVARAAADRAAADAEQARARLAAAEAAVVAARAQWRDAEFEARRTEELRRSGVGAVRDAARAGFALESMRARLLGAEAEAAQAAAQLASAEAAARLALAQVQSAEATAAQRAAQLRQVEVNLSFATIRSPIDGIVISRSVDIGQTVAASLQAPVLFTIAANLDEMEVWVTVDESDIGRIRPGQSASFTVAAHPNVTLTGRVKEVRLAATTVNNVVTYTVVVSAPNAGGRMLPGMTATMRIITDERRDVLRVPNAALRWRPPGAAGDAASPAASPLDAALAALPDLSPAQRQEIEAARAELRERLAALPQDAEARRQAAQAARQRMFSRINAVLTPEQRARLAAQRGARGSEAGTPGTVYVLDGPTPRAVPVRIGLTDGSVTEIISGELEEGMRVVVGTERSVAPARASAPMPRLF